ncbi:MAG: DUF4136 domain-containing protein [Syntrophaceae bacterium]
MPIFSRRSLFLIFLGFLLIAQTACHSRIKDWSQEVYRTSDPLTAELRRGKLAVLPVMILELPAKDDKKRMQTKQPPAPYAPDDLSFEPKEIPQNSMGSDAERLGISEILLRKLSANINSITVISPGECLKRINDSGLTATYLRFDRNFPKLGVDGESLTSFSRALGSRYLLISAALITENNSDSSITVIWTFGRKSVLRTVRISGQIWDAESGRKLWEGYAVGYNSMVPYESPPISEEVMDQAVESFVNIMLPGPIKNN